MHTSKSVRRSSAARSHRAHAPRRAAPRRAISTRTAATTRRAIPQASISQQTFRASVPAFNPRRDKLAEAVLNIQKPKKPFWQRRSETPVPDDAAGAVTGAVLAPIGLKSIPGDIDLSTVNNTIPPAAKLTAEQQLRRQLFFNTFPRQTVLPAGEILKTQYTNYSLFYQNIDWASRLPNAIVFITVKEKPDNTTALDTRWYKEAMSRPKGRIDVQMHTLDFLTKLEQQLLGEILGARYDWRSGRITISVGNLRNRHASINRCFQYLHEAAFRAIEIAPYVQDEQNARMKEYATTMSLRGKLQRRLQAELPPVAHKARPTATFQNTKFLTVDGLNYAPFDESVDINAQVEKLPKDQGFRYLGLPPDAEQAPIAEPKDDITLRLNQFHTDMQQRAEAEREAFMKGQQNIDQQVAVDETAVAQEQQQPVA